MKTETIILNKDRNVTLTANLLLTGGELNHIPKRPAIIVIPGGGYQMCSDREADPVALRYAAAGYHTFILRYSIQENAKWPNPLDDYEQAMTLIRQNAEEWHIYADKIAVIGFSAGGHLAACAATMAEQKPNAAILGYPVIVESSAHTWEATAPDAAKAVDENTCPCFIFGTRDDDTVPVENALQFSCALAANKVSFETHIYAYGIHGFSLGDSTVLSPEMKLCSRARNWAEDSIGWLKDVFGEFGDGCMTEPQVSFL